MKQVHEEKKPAKIIVKEDVRRKAKELEKQ
jgi:hypothetical protein